MDLHHSRHEQPSCPVQQAGLPGCDTGPAGRLAFVVRELSGALQRRRTPAKEERR